MRKWPLHFIACLPEPVVLLASHMYQKPSRPTWQVCLPLVGISGELGPIAPACIVPLQVMLPPKNGASAFCSAPGLGGAI